MLMTTNQFNKARMRHWLNHDRSALVHQPDFALALERAPSPDPNGVSQGQYTWYDHAGKDPLKPWVSGTQIMPSLVARRLPNGSTWYEAYTRNAWGLPTAITSTYGTANPATTRTHTHVYAANGIDLLEERGPSNQLLRSYTYNARHQVLTARQYAAASTYCTTTYTYDSYGRLQTRALPTGLTSTFSYGADHYLSQISDLPVTRVESFTWLNGRIRTHTDPRGLTVTKTWDDLDRLTLESYPDSTTTEYSYALQPGMGFNTGGTAIPILDLCGVKDRLGHWTRYGYDRGRHRTQVKDPRNNVTTYSYCGCGGPESITDPLDNTTVYLYDNAGRKTDVIHPDLTSESYVYNALGQLVSRSDALGTTTYAYNNQGLLITVTGPAGVQQQINYNILDQPTSVTDANAVTTTQSFDWLGRVLTRTAPDNGIERFLYTARGLVAHTNQLSKVWRYEYDAAARQITETNANSEIIRFTYNPAGDLLTLRDGKNQVTTWNYDLYGRLTNKLDQASASILRYQYDANSRLTNRWSAAKGTTTYRYDTVGNLTNVLYATSPGITNRYDALNRVTNRVDGAGTHQYTYHLNGQLLTEDGPWANDTVTYGYNNARLRSSLSLQQPTGAWTNGFLYDAAARLSRVTSPAGAYTNTYRGAGTLVTNLALPNGSRITNAFDNVGRLTMTRLRTSGGTILNTHSYLYNQGHQRTRQTRTDASYADLHLRQHRAVEDRHWHRGTLDREPGLRV
jgi:YD repeat-containing protein